jgi:hypothetical protein
VPDAAFLQLLMALGVLRPHSENAPRHVTAKDARRAVAQEWVAKNFVGGVFVDPDLAQGVQYDPEDPLTVRFVGDADGDDAHADDDDDADGATLTPFAARTAPASRRGAAAPAASAAAARAAAPAAVPAAAPAVARTADDQVKLALQRFEERCEGRCLCENERCREGVPDACSTRRDVTEIALRSWFRACVCPQWQACAQAPNCGQTTCNDVRKRCRGVVEKMGIKACIARIDNVERRWSMEQERAQANEGDRRRQRSPK